MHYLIIILFAFIALQSTISNTIAATISLPKTGQTTCYDSSGISLASCSGTGQDGDLKAGAAWPTIRFTVNGDQTVADNLTGLIWSKDANPANTTKTWQEALNYIKQLNNQNYLGHSDWRVPNIIELQSLSNLEQGNISNYLALQGFINVQSATPYWSSTTYAYNSNTNKAWNFYMNLGYPSYISKSESYLVWPVRDGQNTETLVLASTGQTMCYDSSGTTINCSGTGQDGELQKGSPWDNPRFTVNSNTVTDNVTGLIWTQDANLVVTRDSSFDSDVTADDGAVTLQHALDYINKLNSEAYLGYSDWRLPNRNELGSLVNYQQSDGAIWLTSKGFANIQNKFYWSSTTHANFSYGEWGFSPGNGLIAYDNKTGDHYVWPVRGGTVNGACGLADGTTSTAIPSSNLCSTGTASIVSGFGPWSWSCVGSNGGTSASCSANIQTYTLSLSKAGTGTGSVIPSIGTITWTGSNGSVSYNSGTLITLTATPAAGSTFTVWSGDCSGTGACQITMNAAKSVTATFTLSAINGVCGSNNGATLTAAPTGNLCTSGTASSVTGSGPWPWTCAGSNGGISASCSANIQTYTLSLSKAGTGTGSVTLSTGTFPWSGASGSASYNSGTILTLTAIPTSGSTFAGWSGACTGTSTTCNVTMNVAQSIAATFNIIPIAINGSCGISNGATLAAVPTANLCTSGTASIVSGSGPWSWSCAGNNGGISASCSANIQTYTLALSKAGTGTGSITPNSGAITWTGNSGSTSFNSNTALTLTATPATGSTFTGWAGACTGTGACAITMSAAKSVIATFTLTPINGACGNANGTSLTVIPTSNLCTSGTASSVTGSGPWSWSCVGSNGGTTVYNCTANLLSYPLSITKSGTGTGNVTPSTGTITWSGASGSASYNSGTILTLTAIPNSGSTFAGWSGACTGTSTTCNVTMNVAQSVAATFNIVPIAINGSCGISNGATLTAIPTANLCTSGTATIVSGSGPWSWSCAGSNGGTSISCSASYVNPAIGVCGSSSGNSLTKMPTSGLCNVGSASAITGTGPWSWTCSGTSTAVNCSASLAVPVNGACGTANNTDVTSAPTNNLCAYTNSTASVTGTGPWSWSCSGANGGATVNCSASVKVTQAKVFISSSLNEAFTIANSGVTLYGRLAREVITINSGVNNVTLDQNIDRLNLTGAVSNFTFKQLGNLLVVYNATDTTGTIPVVTLPVQSDSDGTQIGFTDGVYNAKLDAGQIAIGGATVSHDTPTMVWPNMPTSTTEPALEATSSAMIFMGNNNTFTVINSGVKVYGNSGTEVLTIASGASNVTIDQNIEQVKFNDPSSSYTFLQSGNNISIYDSTGTTLIAQGPVQTNPGTKLTFSNGSGYALMTNGGIMQLGGAEVISTMPPEAISATVFTP